MHKEIEAINETVLIQMLSHIFHMFTVGVDSAKCVRFYECGISVNKRKEKQLGFVNNNSFE